MKHYALLALITIVLFSIASPLQARMSPWCIAIPSANVYATNVQVLCTGSVHTPTPSVDATSTPTPPPSAQTLDHVVISEVYYDVDSDHGSETRNEWIELYNATTADVDISGWAIEDASGTKRVLPGSITLPSDCLAVVMRETSTLDYWDIPSDATSLVLDTPLGNGLGNTGDVIKLLDAQGNIVDSVSWGANTDAFDPSADDVPEGSSLARIEVYIDTNKSEDWIARDEPTPGSK